MDEKTKQAIGKLLLDEADEEIEPDKSTYSRLFALFGGLRPVVFVFAMALFDQFLDKFREGQNASFALTDPDAQASEQMTFLLRSATLTIVCVLLRQGKSLFSEVYKGRIGRDILKDTLAKVMHAPVNTFFDVTPVGKILKLFQDDINVFGYSLLEPILEITSGSANIVYVASVMLSIGFWETLVTFVFFAVFCSQVVTPYLAFDSQLQKVGSTLWGPIHSYFYECMSGTTVIRAFNEEKTIMKRQHELLDKTTTHLIAQHSSWGWYNLRMMVLSKGIFSLALYLIAKNRTTTDTVTLILLFNSTQDMGIISEMVSCVNWFKSSC